MICLARRALLVVFVLLMTGCATLVDKAPDWTKSKDTFAVCKTADVVTTGYALSTGLFVEKNPLVAAVISHGIWPLVVVSALLVYANYQWGDERTSLAANTITCPVAAHNLWLLLK